jgi:signal transduction histidine kinase
MIETQRNISDTNRIFYELEQFSSNYKDLSISLRTFLITGDTTDLASRENNKNRIQKNIRSLQSMMNDSTALADLNELSNSLVNRTESFGEVVIKLRKNNGYENAQQFFSEFNDQVHITEHIPHLIFRIKSRMEELLRERMELSDKNAERTIAMVILGTIISIFLVLIALYIITKDRRQIKLHVKEIERAKFELEDLANQLQKYNAKLLNFSHITSHDLRSPVSNLNSLLQLYKESTSKEDKEMLFHSFETVIHHLTSTLNNLIETLRIQEASGKIYEPIKFEDIYIKTVETLSGDIMETSAIITRDFSKAEKIVFRKTYLESIMLNLLSNAIKYRSPNRTPVIHFQTEYIKNQVLLTIRDNGLGIDLEKHGNKLFGLNETFHPHPEAKGVGLYITKTQVESLGGSIAAESVVGEGTVFKILLPSKKE